MTRAFWCRLFCWLQSREPPMLITKTAEWECRVCRRRWDVGIAAVQDTGPAAGTFRPELLIAEARKQKQAQRKPAMVTPIRSMGGRTL